MTKKQEALLPELLQNFIISFQMGGLAVSEVIQSMCLSVLNGEHTLEDCLYQLNTKLLRSEADIEAGRVCTQDELDRRMEGRFAHGTDSKV